MKDVILSYDYELFFGVRSGTVEKTLIIPTNRLMDAMEQESFRGNFFIDVLMIKYIRLNTDDRSKNDLRMIEDQLCDMVRRGHRIELHLHPHWIDANYNGDGTWNYNNYMHYSLNSLNAETIIQMFEEGTNYLNTLAHRVNPVYKVCAFRAGGWAVQPFDMLKKAFEKTGIVVDSSSAFGVYNFLPNSYYDFRNIPQKSYYRFNSNICKEVPDGKFIEVPITTLHRSFFNVFTYKLNQFINKGYNSRITDGTHTRIDLPRIANFNRLYNFFFPKKIVCMFGFSMYDPKNLLRFMKKYNHLYYCFIDHPKDMTPATCECIHAIGREKTKSVTYKDIMDVVMGAKRE